MGYFYLTLARVDSAARHSGGVGYRPPRPAASAEPAYWLTDRINLWGQHWVTNLVDSGFQAYARLLHPLGQPGAPTWAEVARANGRTMHPSVQWDRIRSPEPFNPDNDQWFQRGRAQPGDPMPGQLNTWALEELCAILAGHTATPRTCYFAVWQGCGLDRPPVTMIAYPHVIEVFSPKTPHFFWPADHAWCVATDNFEDSTVIRGSSDLVDQLCASEDIEVLQIAPDAPHEDQLNL
jgi:hypothetical protein